MKWQDEIVEEVRKAREAYAAQFDYDLKRMFEDLKKKEKQDPSRLAKLKPVKPRKRGSVALRASRNHDRPRRLPTSQT